MKLPHKAIWIDLGFGNDYSVIVAAKLTKPIHANEIVLIILDSKVLRNKRSTPQEERMKKIDKIINEFKIKYEVPDEFIQQVSTR